MQTDNVVSIPVAADLSSYNHRLIKVGSGGANLAQPGDVVIGSLLHPNLKQAFSESVTAADGGIGRACAVMLKTGNVHFVTLGGTRAVAQADILSLGADGTVGKQVSVTGATIEADDDTVTKVAHGLVNGDTLKFTTLTGGAGLSTSTLYYVVNKTDDTFQLSLSAGGAAVNVTTDYSVATGSSPSLMIAVDSAPASSADGVFRAVFL